MVYSYHNSCTGVGPSRPGGAPAMFDRVGKLYAGRAAYMALHTNRRRQLVAAAVLAALLLVLLVRCATRPYSADDVAQLTANALVNRDFDALLRLTLPEERSRLNLTRENVSAVLNELFYTRTPPHKLTPRLHSSFPVDQREYVLTSVGTAPA